MIQIFMSSDLMWLQTRANEFAEQNNMKIINASTVMVQSFPHAAIQFVLTVTYESK